MMNSAHVVFRTALLDFSLTRVNFSEKNSYSITGVHWEGLRVYLTLLRHCVEGELSKVLSDVTLTSLL